MAGEPSFKGHPHLNVAAVRKWQFENHGGFVHAFVSTTQHGPLIDQHADWAKVGSHLRGDTPTSSPVLNRLKHKRILVILGEADDIVLADEISQDLQHLFGGSKLIDVRIMSGDHGFPFPCHQEVEEHIWQFWEPKMSV